MRILHVDTGATWRGGQQQLSWLMQGLRERGDEQRLVSPASPLTIAMEKSGFDVMPLRCAGVSLTNMLALRRAARKFDIVHAHDSRAHTLAWLSGCAKIGGSRPLLVVSRRVGFPVGRFASTKFASADAFIAVSNYCRQQLLAVGVDPRKVHVVFDGVELPRAAGAAEREDFRCRFGAGGSAEKVQIIGTLTSIAPEKLLRDEIDLLASLPATVHLWIGCPAGPTTSRDEAGLVEYAAQRGVRDRFRVFPLSDDLVGFFAALDIFIYLSKSEGLGSAILLAMAYGLPVVASRVGGVPEIVHHRETGLLVSEDSTDALPAVMRSLLESAELRGQLGEAARNFISQNATTQMMVSKTRAVYEQLLRLLGGAGDPALRPSAVQGDAQQVHRTTGGTA